MLRTLGVAVVTFLLVVSLVGANAVVGIDRGPLNAEHTSEAFDRAGLAEFLHDEAVDRISAGIAGSDINESIIPVEAVVEDAVTPAWIQAQIDRNLPTVYAYMRGERETLVIELDLDTLQNTTEAALREHVDIGELAAAQSGNERLQAFLESEETYEQERLAVREELLAQIGVSPDNGFGQPTLAAMIESEAGYDAQRSAFRDRIVAEIIERSGAREGFGIAELEVLLANEESYEDRQAAFREAQKERMNNESPRDHSDEELEAMYERREDQIIENTSEALAHQFALEGLPTGYDPPVTAFANLTAHGLASNMSYATFVTRYEAQVASLENDLRNYVATSGDELHDALRPHVSFTLPKEAPDVIEDDAAALRNLVMNATTTEMSYETFAAEYRTIADRIVNETTTALWENRDEYADMIDERLGAQRPDLPGPLADDVTAAQHLAVEAVLTDLEYAAFNDRLDAIEANATAGLVTYIFDERMPLDQREDVTSQLEQQGGNQLSLAKTAFGLTGTVGLGLVAVSVLLAGAIVLITRTFAGASIVIGMSSALVGGTSLAGLRVASSSLTDPLRSGDLPPEAVELIPELVTGLLGPMQTQSVLLLGLGIGLVGLGAVGQFTGLLERGGDAPITEE